MNMKKTIAAIAAGAVAVSAMATTTSALAAKTLTYNLVKTTKNQDAAGTITATFTNVPLEAGGTLVIDPIAGNSWNTIVTISGSFWDDAAGVNKSFTPVVATGMDWETGYSIEGSRLWNDGNGTVEVPVVASTAQGTNVALKATSSAVITVTVKYTDLPDSVSYAGALNGLIKEGKRGIKISSVGNSSTIAAASPVPTYTDSTGAKAKAIRTIDQTAVNALAGLSLEYDGTNFKWVTTDSDKYTVSGLKLVYNGVSIDPTEANLAAAGVVVKAPAWMQGESWAAGTYNFNLGSDGNLYVGTAASATGTNSGGWQFDATSLGAGWSIVNAPGDAIAVTFAPASQKAGVDMTAAVNNAFTFIQTVVNGDKLSVSLGTEGSNGVLYASDLSGAALETSGNSETKRPYHSTLNNKTITNFNQGWYDGDMDNIFGNVGSGNVITWIGYASDDNKTWGTEDHQAVSNAIMSVINDAVQNYNDVVFTFNTATSNVEITRNNKGEIIDYKYTNDGVKGREIDGDNSKEIVNYTAFGRHYWDKETGYDPTMYITNDWLGNNLFEGALIINNNLTLSLGATDKFDWTATSLSFSWDAIQDAALTQNQYANYIQTMVLRTSTDWFWDNITVELGETEVEEVDSGAPVEGDTEDLPEDEEDDFGMEEEEEEEEEPEVEAEPEPEVAPVETATNPGTGNAPVALAVIPVALAAAAIVAKKRG